MVTWIELYDYYLNDIVGCSYKGAENALREAAQEFCQRTKVWRVTMDPVSLVSGNSIYAFDLPTEQEVSQLTSAKINNQPVTILLYDEQGAGFTGITVLNVREYMVQPVPSTGQTLVMKACLKPSNSARGIEDFVSADDAKAIAIGAKAKLLGMASKPYSNPGMAEKLMQDFNTMTAVAAMRVARAYSSAPVRVKPSFM